MSPKRARVQRGPYVKPLEDGTAPRRFLTAVDPEDGRRHFWEAVEEGGGLVAIRQLVIQGGLRWRYDWQHLEDENGFLTEAPLYLDKNIVLTTQEVFRHEWEAEE